MLETGLKGKKKVLVTEENTAKQMKSGTLPVFATPALAALMEETAYKSVETGLLEGEGTVGASLELKHLAPTPLGMEVTCESELLKVEGKKLTFLVTASDAAGQVGEAIHVRYVIEESGFMKKAERRKAENA